MDLLKKMESVQQRADQVDLKAEQRSKELTNQLKNIEGTIGVIQELNSRLVGTLSKFSGRFNHIINSIDKIETHLEDKIENINTCIEHNSKLNRDLTERVSGFEERQHNGETKLQQLEKMYTEGTLVAEMVGRQELSDSLLELRDELGNARSELRGNLADAASVADIDGIREQLGEIRTQFQTLTREGDQQQQPSDAPEELRPELEQIRDDLRQGLASAAPAGDLSELGKQVDGMAAQLRAMSEDVVAHPELEAMVKGLRGELDQAQRRNKDSSAELRGGLQELQGALASSQTAGGLEGAAATEDLSKVTEQVEALAAQVQALTEDGTNRQTQDGAREERQEGDQEKLQADLNELRANLDSIRGAVDGLDGAASAEDLDALREELAHAVTDMEAVRNTADTKASADLVGRDELAATAERLSAELQQAKTDLQGSLAAADDVFALREQLASHGTELEAMTGDTVKRAELSAEVDKLRAELDDARYQLRGSLSGAATADDLEALKEQITSSLEELQAPKEMLVQQDLKSALNDLRFEFNAVTDDLRHGLAGAASADDLDAIKHKLAGNTAEFKSVASAVMPQEMEAELNKLRDEQMAALEEVRQRLDGAASAGELATFKEQLDQSPSPAGVEEDLTSVKHQLELALNDIEFIKSAQADQGSGSVEDLRIEMAAVQATLQDSASEDKTRDIEALHKQFVGLAMDVSSTETELKKRMDEIQRKNRMLDQEMRKKLIAADGAGPVTAGADASVGSIRKEVEKITTGYARKSEVNTAIKETNAAFRKIVQDFDTKQVELRNVIAADAEARIQKLHEKTEDAMSRFQHMINEFQQEMDASAGMHKEFKDLKQQMILTQNAIMELNQFVEDQLKKQE